MYKNIIIKIFALLIIFSTLILAQNSDLIYSVSDTFKVNLENKYLLSAINIVPFSESVYLHGSKINLSDYKIKYPFPILTLSNSLKYSLFDTLIINYNTTKLPFKSEYRHQTLVYKFDNKLKDSLRVLKSVNKPFTAESIFGKNIRKSGAIIRGFTIGTNKDFSLNSGLRLQLSGKLSNDIEVVAALTDENTPIQPEGNTETLQELDKVFIEIRHPNAVGTFGDYNFNQKIGEFGTINRKLQGFKAKAHIKNMNASIALAGSRGKYYVNSFMGSDGVQGPYRLHGINNERTIIIIAGSEKVYIDGKELKRGDNNGYTIEYANAEITFTPNVLITSASRISVDFEYTDRKYDRSFFGGNFQTKLFNNKVRVKLSYAQEGDNTSSPIDFTLTKEDKSILAKAGDERNAAVISGVSLAKPDSNGNTIGTYIKADTLINGETFTYYVYSPGNPNSLYNVQFSFVGNGKGDYIRETIGNFKFIGKNKGTYLPLVFLPMPQLKQSANIVLEAAPIKELNLSLELAGSLFDRNRLSSKDDNDNDGFARNIKLELKPKEITIGKINLGKIGLNYKDRFVQKRFSSMERFNNVEFDRDYNINSVENNDETLREFVLTLNPVQQLNIYSKYGFLKRGELKSKRYVLNAELKNNENYEADFNLDYVNSRNALIKTKWMRQNGTASYLFGFIKPGVDYLYENKEDRNINTDSLFNTSLKYFELGPFIQLLNYKGLSVTAKYSLRTEHFPLNSILEKESIAKTYSYILGYSSRPFSTNAEITFRNKDFTQKFKSLGRLNNQTVLIRENSRFNFLNRFLDGSLYYQAATEKTAKLERVFVKVKQGSGNYEYLGDLNNDGIAQENEFAPTIYNGNFIITTIPTDELFPIINLKTNLRFKLKFNKLVKSNSWVAGFIKPISTETSFRIEEKSKEKDTKNIYLLKLSHFLNDSTTINGFNTFQQDIFLFKNRNDLSFRFRYLQRKSLNQFSSGIETGYFRERSIRIDFRLVKEMNNRTEFVNQIDNVLATSVSNRSRIVTSNNLISNFSYRPMKNVEVGFRIKVGKTQDNFPETPTIIDENSELLRFTLSFAGKGRLRVEAERIELNPNNLSNQIPFEILRGNSVGKNYRWDLNFDYRVADNLQININYNGRLQGIGKVINTMRAEARAYF